MKNLSFWMIILLVINFSCKNKTSENNISEQKLDYNFLMKNTPTLLFTTGHDLNNKSASVGVTLKMMNRTTMGYDFCIQDWKKEKKWKGLAKLIEIDDAEIVDIQKNIIPAFEFQDREKKIIIRILNNTKLSESMAQIFKENEGKLSEMSPLLYYK